MSNRLHEVALDDPPDWLADVGPGLPQASIAQAVLDARQDLLAVLTQVATYQAAEDEIYRSLRVISGAAWELRRYDPRPLGKVATFLPSNNLLYSYVLHGIIPGLYSARVSLRPSARVAAASLAVHEILQPALRALGLRLELQTVSQRAFAAECSSADVTIFTGRPENAAALSAGLPADALMLAFGSGPNPIVVGPEADADVAARAIVRARTYNSGQDCLCPDIVFVHRSLAAEVITRIEAGLTGLTVGDRRSPGTDVAALVYPDAAASAAEFLHRYAPFVRRGGHRDPLIEPSLVVLPWTPGFYPPELFSPIVLVMDYPDAGALEEWLTGPAELERGMYLSIFGESRLPRGRVGTCAVIREATTFDVEDGNQPFGGYGIAGGCVRRGDTVIGRPLLLSAEVSRR